MINGNAKVPVEILLVEDNEDDYEFTLDTMKESKIDNTVHWVQDGMEAMAFLHKEGKYGDAPFPDIIFLDLNLPKKDGREVLEEIKSDALLRRIPIVILTTSKAEEDILKAYNLHANCYITKPVDLHQFSKVVKSIQEFWFSIVKLPPRPVSHEKIKEMEHS